MKNINFLKQEKIMPQLMLNPGLAITGFQTTWPRVVNSHCNEGENSLVRIIIVDHLFLVGHMCSLK